MLRQPEDGRGVRHQPQAGAAADAADGTGGDLPQARTTRPAAEHQIYPYLLRNVAIVRPNQVWSSDITYVPMPHGWMYLTVVMDWYSRYVLSWRLSNTLDGTFCLEALEEALAQRPAGDLQHRPGRAVHGQGVHRPAGAAGVAISMDGRGRGMDNVFVERLWRTVKYEDIYLNDYDSAWHAEDSLAAYFRFYCQQRVHQALDYATPAAVYQACR